MKRNGTRLKAKMGGVQMKRLSKLRGEASVLVGILSGAGEHPKAESGQTLAEVAFWNEFGTSRIPPRPFLTRTVREKNYYKSEFKSALKAYLGGKKSSIVSLNLIGLRASNDVKLMITSIMTPPNAPSTQRAKADKSHVTASAVNNPLIDSGSLRAAINYQVVT